MNNKNIYDLIESNAYAEIAYELLISEIDINTVRLEVFEFIVDEFYKFDFDDEDLEINEVYDFVDDLVYMISDYKFVNYLSSKYHNVDEFGFYDMTTEYVTSKYEYKEDENGQLYFD